MIRRGAALLVILATAGCAVRQRPVPPERDVMAESLAALRAGCYRCLEAGFALVEGRTDAGARQRAFELALLLVARAKELGTPFERWRDRAGALAPAAAALPAAPHARADAATRSSPAPADAAARDSPAPGPSEAAAHDSPGPGPSGPRPSSAARPSSPGSSAVAVPLPATAALLALVDALPVDPASRDRDQGFGRLRPPPNADVRRWLAAADASGLLPETSLYLQLAGACAFYLSDVQQTLRERVRAPDTPPLLDYALGRCTGDAPALMHVLEREPRFLDAALPLARIHLRPHAGAPNVDALEFFMQARAAFPESPAIAFSVGALLRERRQWARALAEFDATLQLVPTHHDARLGRVMALSNLGRHDEAITGATSLITDGTWLVGDAYYWRAWNELHVGRLDEAERDVEAAKSRVASSSVFVLSGLVQWRKGHALVAEEELMRAVNMSADDCDAASYLGSVRGALRKWLPAAAAFTSAASCREREAQLLRTTLADLISRGAADVVVTAQRESIAVVERQIAEAVAHRNTMLSATLDAYRLEPPAFCELPAESSRP